MLMTLKILQWHLNGFCNNLAETQFLVNNESADIIALQETHLKSSSINFRNYSYSKQNSETDWAQGGTAIKNSIIHSYISLPRCFCTGAFTKSKQIITFPSSGILPINELNSICSSINTPISHLADFNAHSSLWRSTQINSRRKSIENFFLLHNPIHIPLLTSQHTPPLLT